MSNIQLAIVDDENLFRAGIKLAIAGFDGIEVCLEAGNGRELLDQLAAGNKLPDLLLMDLKMPVLNGVETAKVLEKEYPEFRIIILSSYFSEAFVLNMVELGAAAYLPKNSALAEVETTLRAVADKGFYYNDEVLQILRAGIQGKTKPDQVSFTPRLTPREQEILQLICEQYTNPEIAAKLYISDRTVDGHRMNLLQKLGCRNTAGLVALAIQQKLVRIDPSRFW